MVDQKRVEAIAAKIREQLPNCLGSGGPGGMLSTEDVDALCCVVLDDDWFRAVELVRAERSRAAISVDDAFGGSAGR